MSSSFRGQHGAFCINEHSRTSSLFSLPEVKTRNFTSSPTCVQELQDLISRQDEFFMGPVPSSTSTSSTFGSSLRHKVIGMGPSSSSSSSSLSCHQQQQQQQQEWENHSHLHRSFLSHLNTNTSNTSNNNNNNNNNSSNNNNTTILQQVMNNNSACHNTNCNSENHLPSDYCYRPQASTASSVYHPFGYNFWSPSKFPNSKDQSSSSSSTFSSKLATNHKNSSSSNRNFLSFSPITFSSQNNGHSTTTTSSTSANNNGTFSSSFRPYSSAINSQFNVNSSEGYFSRSPSSPASGGSSGSGSSGNNNKNCSNNNNSGGGGRRSGNISSDSGDYLCVFCKSNNEPESIYRSHPLRLNNIVVCPSLRNYTCCICKSTGDNAHTIKYCPYNKRGFYATRSHEKCNTNNNSKYKMKVHVVESMDSSDCSSNNNVNSTTSTNNNIKSTSSSASSTFSGQQQEKDTFHRRHFRPIPLTPTYMSSDDDDDDDASLLDSPSDSQKGRLSSSRNSSLNHQLVFFNRTMQKRRS